MFGEIATYAGNALIELIEHNGTYSVKREDMYNYAIAISNILQEQDITYVPLFDRVSNLNFEYENGDIFNFTGDVISCKKGVTEDMLRSRFRGYLSLDVLKATINPRALLALGIEY